MTGPAGRAAGRAAGDSSGRPAVSPAAAAAVEAAHRREWGFVLAATARVARDLDIAEECVQDAYVAALAAWSRQGVPENPAAWLTTAARRKALDALRRDKTFHAKLPLLIEPEPAPDAAAGPVPGIADDRLRLVFTCCHPALAREAQVALTLRLVCGLSTAEIAAAFLVPEATMAARVTRAKKKIAAARIPYRVPAAAGLPDRLDAVLTVIHLLYTTGHTAPAGGALLRDDLAGRAISLAQTVVALMPDEREARGLLALLMLSHARRAARTDAGGRLVLLADQDRARWDRDAIAAGAALVAGALRGAGRGGRPGRFALQAAIAAVHAEAPSYEATDWPEIARPVRRAAGRLALAGGGAEPGGRARHGGRPGRRAGADRGAGAGGRPAGVLPVPARGQGRPAPPGGPRHRGGAGLPRRPGPGRQRGRAGLPGRAAG